MILRRTRRGGGSDAPGDSCCHHTATADQPGRVAPAASLRANRLGWRILWTVWIVRFTLSRVYRPSPTGYTTTTSVVVPSYREDPDILDRCLQTWLSENPTEVIVVPDVADTEVIARLSQRAATEPRLKVLPFVHHGKRSALGVGIRQAAQEILVLCDSDTSWEPGLLAAVLAPFANPKVGGVGTGRTRTRRRPAGGGGSPTG